MGIGDFAEGIRDQGHEALGGTNVSSLESKVVYSQGQAQAEARLPEGYILTGGGIWTDYPLALLQSRPSDDGKGWVVKTKGLPSVDGYEDRTVWAYVVGIKVA